MVMGGRANLPAEKEVANNFLSQTPLELGFCVPIEEGGPDKGMEGEGWQEQDEEVVV